MKSVISYPFDLEVKTPTRNQCLIINKVYRNCEIWVGERKFLTDLMSLTIKGYDVTTKNTYHLPLIDELFDQLLVGRGIFKLDLR